MNVVPPDATQPISSPPPLASPQSSVPAGGLPNTTSARPELPEMSLRDHLLELRKRLLYALVTVLIATVGCLYFVDIVFDFLTGSFHEHFEGAMLIGTSPAEAFILKLKVALFSGLLASCPILFFQLWRFIEPGLYDEEKRLAIPFVLVSTLLFFGGVAFCHESVLPIALDFFAAEYKSVGITPTIKVSEHISLVVQTLVGFGVAFELPVVSFVLARLGVIDAAMMKSGFRYALIVIFIIAALLTPPDVLSQFLMAGPLVLLYGISMVVVKWTERRGKPSA